MEDKLIQKGDCRRRPRWTLDFLGGGKHHSNCPKPIIKQILKAAKLSLEEASFLNQRYQENKIISPSASLALISAEDRLPLERSLTHASVDNIPQKES